MTCLSVRHSAGGLLYTLFMERTLFAQARAPVPRRPFFSRVVAARPQGIPFRTPNNPSTKRCSRNCSCSLREFAGVL